MTGLAVVAYTPDHYAALAPAGLTEGVDPDALVHPLSRTLLLADEPVIAGGFLPQTPPPHGRAVGWCAHNGVYWRLWPFVTRFARLLCLQAHGEGYCRLEAHVRVDFKAGGRWLRQVGFHPEAYMEKFQDGRGFFLYAKVDK